MYRLIFTMYETGAETRFHALFEHQSAGKTETLAKQRRSLGTVGPVRKLSHAEAYDEMRGLVPLFLALLPASLVDELEFPE